MSDQIIVQIAKGWNNLTFLQLMRAPNVPVDDVGIMQLQCDPATLPAWTQPDAVKAHGQILLNCLMNSHDRVKDALQHALDRKPGDSCPIYLHLKALPAAEVFCWEALCNAAGTFIALDKRWPIARIAGSPQLAMREASAYEPPLRIMAVLSALGRDATQEWDGLYGAVKQARQAGLPIRLHVATGQEALQDGILELARTDGLLTQFPLESVVDLVAEADRFAPHIVHFFSHGSTTFDKPRLHLATLNDKATSSIELELPDLLGSPGIRDSWLAVLNCCESGAASEDVHSLTHSLVAGGLNAALGMKETVSELDAFEFSGRLYPGILETLTATLVPLPHDDEAVIDWAGALWGPRMGLRARHKGNLNAHEWTLPILYAQPELLRVRRAAPVDARVRAHKETIDDALALLPDDKRGAFLAELASLRAGN